MLKTIGLFSQFKHDVFRRLQAPVTLHKIAPKISLGDIHCQKGGYGIPNNMSHFLAELSLKNLPESHEFCAFGIHIEH